MLRKRLSLSLVAGRLTTQVIISVVATMIGSTVVSLLHVGSGPSRPPAVELTSGGKFAARVPGGAEAETLTADDRMTVSSSADGVSPTLEASVVPLLSAASAPAAFITEAASLLDKPLRSRPHPVRLSGLRHGADAPLPVARRIVTPVVDAGPSASDDGIMLKALASARSLWSFSASAGSALFFRLAP